ncbi:MAG TPA: SulP family inorganic anion transporter, partial [Gemmatimonadaceae bacterium]|nr:SulP family inorganic anion transporter [Gemmatimonadaceae bacterium]
MLVPKLFSTLRGYDRAQFVADLTAGVIVGIVALPLCIAFAIASGVSPERGLITGIIAGFLISFLGGSRVQIGGPTGAFVVIVYGIVQQFGVDGLLVATLMSGIILVVMGLTRMGGAIKFIPFPVTTGFTSGIALIIFSSQVKDFLGLRMGEVPAEFFAKWGAYAAAFDTVNLWALVVAVASLAILIFWPKVSVRVPAPFVALIATTVVARLADLPVETIGSRFGALDLSIPAPSLPTVDWPMVRALA